jgi:hypothetical protein
MNFIGFQNNCAEFIPTHASLIICFSLFMNCSNRKVILNDYFLTIFCTPNLSIPSCSIKHPIFDSKAKDILSEKLQLDGSEYGSQLFKKIEEKRKERQN